MSRKSFDPFKPFEIPESEIYRFLILHWQHHNQLSWSKLNVLLALETATLGASFYAPLLISIFIIITGTIVGVILYRLIHRDWHVRDYHLPLLDEVHNGIYFYKDGKNNPIRMIPPALSWFSNGRNLLGLLLITMLITNVAALLYRISPLLCGLCSH